MPNVWKIGAWPGWPGTNYSLKNKNEFIQKHALPENYVAIGWADCDANVDEESFRKNCVKCKEKCRKDVIDQIVNFTKNIKKTDIILLYNHLQVYTGIVSVNYYPNTTKPIHRIGVDWLYDKQPKDADFRLWQDTVHQVTHHDLDKILDKELRVFLLNQLNGVFVINNSIDEKEQNDLVEHCSKMTDNDLIRDLSNVKAEDSKYVTVMQKVYKRDNDTIAKLKKLRKFRCQICGVKIPIRNGGFYIEGAHIVSKSNMGNELPGNILILCPNHHKEFDLAERVIHSRTEDHIKFEMNNKTYDISLSLTNN